LKKSPVYNESKKDDAEIDFLNDASFCIMLWAWAFLKCNMKFQTCYFP